jgi:AcrR family transcriptional regulator
VQARAAAEPARGPGRPSTGARERVLEAGLEVLKAEGYAGLTTAKVAARSGQNKALIAYHFGSKEGLVAAVAGEVSEAITNEVIGGLDGAATVEELVRGASAALWRVLDRDERLARLYFDLAAVSVVEPAVRAVMHHMRNSWRAVVADLLRETEDGPPPRRAEAAAVYVIAGLEGMALERLDRGETKALTAAKEMFARATTAAVGT